MSSNTDDNGSDRRDRTSPEMRAARGAIRRFTLGTTSGVRWQVIGYSLLEGGKEVRAAEVFSNIGFYSRPKSGNNTEAVAVMVDGASNPIIVATRDEDARKLVAQFDDDDDQTAIWNSTTVVLIKGNTVEIKLAGGATQPTILGTTYRTAEDTLVSAIGAFATIIGNLNPATAPAAASALNVAITTFKNAAASYLTQVLKAQ